MKRFALVLFFLSCLSHAKSQKQDLIITTAGFKIYCKIVKDDSVSLYYNIANHLTTLEIKKTEVREYYYDLIRHKERKPQEPEGQGHSRRPSKDLFLFTLTPPGLALPISDFADKNINSATAGLAKVGLVVQAGLTFKFTKNIGICAAYHFQFNPIDKELINQQVMMQNPGFTFTTQASSWSMGGFFGGVYLEQQIESVKGLSFFVNGMVGKPKFKSPEIITTVTTFGYVGSIKQNAASTNAFAVLFGSGFFYKFTNEAGFNFSVNYGAGQADFSNVLVSTSNGLSQGFVLKQKFSTINLQFGFVICIPR